MIDMQPANCNTRGEVVKTVFFHTHTLDTFDIRFLCNINMHFGGPGGPDEQHSNANCLAVSPGANVMSSIAAEVFP